MRCAAHTARRWSPVPPHVSRQPRPHTEFPHVGFHFTCVAHAATPFACPCARGLTTCRHTSASLRGISDGCTRMSPCLARSIHACTKSPCSTIAAIMCYPTDLGCPYFLRCQEYVLRTLTCLHPSPIVDVSCLAAQRSHRTYVVRPALAGA